MQPSGGGGGGGGGRSAQHPGVTQKKGTTRPDEGPGTIFEFVQGFTPMPNPVARTILSDTSLSPEHQQIHATLMGLRDGGSVGFRPLGYADGDLVEAEVDLSKLSDSELAELLAASDLSQIYDIAPRTNVGAFKLNKEYVRRIQESSNPERLRYAAFREGLQQLQQQGGNPSPFPQDYRPATREQVREYKSLYAGNYPGIPEIAVPYAPPVDPTVPPHLEGKAGGGSVGFRPLGYASGGTADADLQRQADHQNALEMIKFYLGQGSDRIPPQERVSTNTLRTLLDAYEKNPDAAIGYWNRLSKLITSGDDMGDLGAISTAPVAPPLAAAPIPTEEVVGMTSFRPEGSTLDEMGSMFDLYRDGGYVKQKYAYGGSVPHGTVAGELPRYGDMSVREEGESMRELAKRHKDQRWYNRMGGGLGSLMRRA